MAATAYARSYLRNIARSTIYTTRDILKDNTPYLNSLFKESKETASDLYHSIKDFTSGKGKEVTSLGKEALDNVFKNLKDDLKSGDFYNQARDQVFDDQMMKMMGFDMDDMDFSFDEDSFDFGSDSDDITAGDEIIVKQNAKNTAATIMAVDKVGAKVASGVNQGTAASANYIVKSNRAMNKALFDLNTKGFATIAEAIATLNKNTISMNEAIAQPLTTFMQNGTVFFAKTTEQLDKITNLLEAIAKVQAGVSTGSSSSRRDRSLNSVLSSGGFSVSAYKDMVGANLKEYTDMVGSLMSMFGGSNIKLSDLSKGISPLRLPMKLLIGSFMPAVLTTALKSFDEGLKDFIPSMMAKAMTSKSGGFLSSILRSIFLPKNDLQRDVGKNYTRGPIAFDGETKRAITYVIPKYLAHITSILSGTDTVEYDYRTGEFIKSRDISKIKEKREREYAARGGGQLREDALKYATSNKSKGEIENFFLQALISGEGFTDINTPNFKNTKLGRQLSPETLKLLQNLVKSGKYNKMPGQMVMTRTELDRLVKDLSASGSSIETALYDNSSILGAKGKLGFTDQYHNTQLDYLRGIYLNTMGGIGRRKGGPVNNKISGIDLPNLGHSVESAASSSSKVRAPRSRDLVDPHDADQTDAWNAKIDKEVESLCKQLAKAEERKKKNPNLDNSNEIERLEARLNKKTDEWIGVDKDTRLATIRMGSSVFSTLESKANSTKQFLRDKLKKIVPEGVLNFFDRPIEAFAGLLNKLTDSMTSFLWGDGTNDGIFTQIKKKISEGINNNPVLSKFLGSGFWTETKDSLKEYWNWMRNSGREKWDLTGSAAGKYMDIDIPTAANGRRITRTGLISVSEGELVIPAEYNPFYRGSINKNTQYARENRAIRNFYGSYAVGGTVYNDRYPIDDVARYEPADKIDKIQRLLSSGGAARDSVLNMYLNKYNKSGDRIKIKGKVYFRDPDGSWHTSEQGSFFRGVGDAFAGAGQILSETASKAKGTVTGERLNAFFDSFGDDFKAARGRMGAGAIIGAGLGGVIGSPVLGMILGTTVGFVSKSEKAQKLLFGEVGEDGEREGGLLPKKVANFLEKNAPGLVKGGSMGALVGGALIGGPVGMAGGLIVGATLEFARSSKTLQEFLFGKVGEDGEVIKKGLIDKQKLQAAMPNAILGAGLGLLLGPIGGSGGLLLNMMLGAGLGFLTTNEKIHTFLFGGKDKDGKDVDGLMQKIGHRLFGGIEDLFGNVGNWLKVGIANFGKNLITKMGNIKEWFTSRAERRRALNNNVNKTRTRRIMEKIGKGAAIGAGSLAALPFLLPFMPAIAGGAGLLFGPRALANARMRRNARRGYNVYSSKEHRNLTAAERIAFRDKTKRAGDDNTWDMFDQALVGKNKDELEQYLDYLNDADEENRELRQLRSREQTNFYRSLGGVNKGAINSAQMDELSRYIKSGDVIGLERYITDHNIDANVADSAMKSATAVSEKRKDIASNKRILRKTLGIKNAKDLTKAQELIKTEIAQMTPEERTAESSESAAKYLKDIYENGIFIREKGSPVSDIIGGSGESALDDLDSSEETKKKKRKKGFKWGFNADMNPIKLKYDPVKDRYVPDERDPDTKKEIGDSEEAEENQKRMPGIFEKMAGGLFDLKTKFFGGDKSEKGSFIDKLKDFGKRLLIAVGVFGGLPLLPKFLNWMKDKAIPWITDKAIPWVMDTAIPWIEETAIPWITKTAIPWITSTWDKVVGAWTNNIKPALDSIVGILNFAYPGSGYGPRSTSTGTQTRSKIEAEAKSNATKELTTSEKVEDFMDKYLNNADYIDTKRLNMEVTDKDTMISVGYNNGGGISTETVYKVNWGGPTDYVAVSTSSYKFVSPDVKWDIGDGALTYHKWYIVLTVGFDYMDIFLDLYNNNSDFKREVLYYINKQSGFRKNQASNEYPTLYQLINEYTSNPYRKFESPYSGASNGSGGRGKNNASIIIQNSTDMAKRYKTASYHSGGGREFDLVGKGTGFVSQLDSKYASRMLGSSTVGQAGCAPAVAAMVAEAYNKTLSMNDAISAAENYTDINGTSTSYFDYILGSKGISAVPADTTSIVKDLAASRPVILLGADPNNKSKNNSPFGPQNHYVLGTGISGLGKIIINDPESDRPREYDPKILNSVLLGVSTGLSGKAAGLKANTSKTVSLANDTSSGAKKSKTIRAVQFDPAKSMYLVEYTDNTSEWMKNPPSKDASYTNNSLEGAKKATTTTKKTDTIQENGQWIYSKIVRYVQFDPAKSAYLIEYTDGTSEWAKNPPPAAQNQNRDNAAAKQAAKTTGNDMISPAAGQTVQYSNNMVDGINKVNANPSANKSKKLNLSIFQKISSILSTGMTSMFAGENVGQKLAELKASWNGEDSGSGSGLYSNAYQNFIGQRMYYGSGSNVHRTNNFIMAGKGNDMVLEQMVSAILQVLGTMVDIDTTDSKNIAAIKTNSDNLATIKEMMKNNATASKSTKSDYQGSVGDTESVVNQLHSLASAEG